MERKYILIRSIAAAPWLSSFESAAQTLQLLTHSAPKAKGQAPQVWRLLFISSSLTPRTGTSA
jgi:hypothetical protein